jgi:hypothetical protein
MWNPNQFATYEEAQSIASQLGPIGGGVKDIYIPEYLGPFSTPEMGERKFFHFRFQNGAEGFNVGLVRTTIRQFANSWPSMIGLEVEACGRSREDR